MSLRLSLAFMPFGLLLFGILTGSAAAADRPNVLWIIAEDFGPDLGCYGVESARTPNIDALAARGMRFTHAFATAPVCSASRSAFMTGMYQTSIGAHNHRSHRDDGFRLPVGVRVLPEWLRDAGYFTANIVRLADERGEKFYRGTGKTDWNFTVEGKPFDSNRWDDLKSHQPFYAQINFSETHRGAAWNSAHQHIEQPADPAKVEIPPYYPDHPLVREDWAQYLNTAMALDKKVGYVLNKLKDDGLAENTVVFFLGDHGRAMPRGKQWCYDSGLRIPLVVAWPEKLTSPQGYEAGTVSDRLVEAIDLAATTIEIAGAEKPAAMQGRILFGDHAAPPPDAVFGARDRCDETVFHIRTVRTSRYRYLRNFDHKKPFLLLNRYKETNYPTIPLIRSLYAEGKLNEIQARLASPGPRPAEELYDLETDPHEVRNLASSAEHRQVLEELRGRLEEWVEATNDQGRLREPASTVREWEAKAQRNSGEKMERLARQWPDAYPLDPRFLTETWLKEQAAAETPAFDPIDRYRPQNIAGWTVRVSDRFDDESPKLLDDVLAELHKQLAAVTAAVPKKALGDLRQIEIWVEVNDPQFPCMCYHANERWLRAHGVNPRKTGHVELANARNFLSWTKRDQPWMVLHELAHGYHDRFLDDGYENAAIREALDAAKTAGRYGEVKHINGSKRQHYAATNPMEYFAESSEAYFGKNDFYPFERKQLQEYDSGVVELLERFWKVDATELESGN